MENHPAKQLLIFIFLYSLILQSWACNPTDQEALLHFKKLINDDPSGLLENWIPSTDCCTSWDGISCDRSSGRVIILDRPGLLTRFDMPLDTSMSGTLSPFLGNLSSLKFLDLCSLKDLTGPIPPELGKLTSLTHLFLCGNRLTGPIPPTFQALTQLKRLLLQNNNFSGNLTPIFSNVGYRSIDISYNNFTGPIVHAFGGKVDYFKVDYLRLSHNRLTGRIPASFGKLSNLKMLELQENEFSGGIPKEVINLEYLQSFNVSGNRLSGEIPPHKNVFPGSAFSDNPGLCGAPLPPCNN